MRKEVITALGVRMESLASLRGLDLAAMSLCHTGKLLRTAPSLHMVQTARLTFNTPCPLIQSRPSQPLQQLLLHQRLLPSQRRPSHRQSTQK